MSSLSCCIYRNMLHDMEMRTIITQPIYAHITSTHDSLISLSSFHFFVVMLTVRLCSNNTLVCIINHPSPSLLPLTPQLPLLLSPSNLSPNSFNPPSAKLSFPPPPDSSPPLQSNNNTLLISPLPFQPTR